MQSGWVPSYPVQFHFNSAEEGGLLGSQAIAAEYKRTGKKVLGFLQMDINGYVGEKGDGRREVIGVVSPGARDV
jgi:leucyl aminopeptidase